MPRYLLHLSIALILYVLTPVCWAQAQKIGSTINFGPQMITSADSSILDRVEYSGVAVLERGLCQPGYFIDNAEVHKFSATYANQKYQLELNFYLEDFTQPDAQALAVKYSELIGTLPEFSFIEHFSLDIASGDRTGIAAAPRHNVWCAETYAFDEIDLKSSQNHFGYTNIELMEERLLHEAVHTKFDTLFLKNDFRDKQKKTLLQKLYTAAQTLDVTAITHYAWDSPNQEDLAETIPAWYFSRYLSERLPEGYDAYIESMIPNRLNVLDWYFLDTPLNSEIFRQASGGSFSYDSGVGILKINKFLFNGDAINVDLELVDEGELLLEVRQVSNVD